MTHLINLKLLSNQLSKVSLPLNLVFLLGKAKHHSWYSKSDPSNIWKPSDIAPGNLASLDHLASATLDIKPQVVGRLSSTHVVGAHTFAEHCCKLSFLHAQLLEYFIIESTTWT